MTMPNASEPVFLAFLMMAMIIITCQLQSIKATLPLEDDVSFRRPLMRRRATTMGSPRVSGGERRIWHESGDPITQQYLLYHACSSRLVRIFGGKIDAKGKQDDIYIELKATTDSFDRIRIQSSLTGDFVCFNKRARLVIRAHGTNAGCFFKETITADFFTEFQSTYNTSWYLGFSQRGTALRGSHWKTDEVNHKTIKCRKFIKKNLRPERKIKETADLGEIKGPGKGRVRAVKIKINAKEKKIGNAARQIKDTAKRRIKDTGGLNLEGLEQYKTG